MSSPPFIYIDEFDGTNGYVKTKGFVNYFKQIQSHEPHQKVYLGDSERGNIMRPCVVFNDEITLEKGCGYRFGGFDHQWDDGEEIQLKLSEGAWVDKFYDPNKE